jgi:hypothetical protein
LLTKIYVDNIFFYVAPPDPNLTKQLVESIATNLAIFLVVYYLQTKSVHFAFPPKTVAGFMFGAIIFLTSIAIMGEDYQAAYKLVIEFKALMIGYIIFRSIFPR